MAKSSAEKFQLNRGTDIVPMGKPVDRPLAYLLIKINAIVRKKVVHRDPAGRSLYGNMGGKRDPGVPFIAGASSGIDRKGLRDLRKIVEQCLVLGRKHARYKRKTQKTYRDLPHCRRSRNAALERRMTMGFGRLEMLLLSPRFVALTRMDDVLRMISILRPPSPP